MIADANTKIELMDGTYDTKQHQVVGIFCLAIYWKDTISNILQEGSDGLIMVFTNPCQPTFTYQINGPETVFLGSGDSHDTEYDDMAVSSSINDLGRFAIQESFYSGVPVLDDFCTMTVTVYPSDTMKENYTTNTPIVFAITAALVFIATAMVFTLYDVSSLFCFPASLMNNLFHLLWNPFPKLLFLCWISLYSSGWRGDKR
jgi:hypothetical protein